MRQFGRRTQLIVGNPGEPGRLIEELRIGFEVTKADDQAINVAKLKIYGLSPDSIAATQRQGATVQLFGGYGAAPGLLFLGDITRSLTTYEDGEVITELESGDLQKARPATVRTTFSEAPSLKESMGVLGEALGAIVDLDALTPTQQDARLPVASLTLSGDVFSQVNRVARLNRLDWTVEDGKLVVMPRGRPTNLPALVVTPDTGLIGSPRPVKRGLEVKLLLSAEVRLRRILRVQSARYDGWYLVRRVKHAGDSGWAREYYTTAECTEIRP